MNVDPFGQARFRSARRVTSVGQAPTSRTAKIVRRVWRLRIEFASLVVFFTIWQVVGAMTSTVLFATPTRVIAAAVDLLRTGQMESALGVATKDVVTGYVLAVVVGLIIGVAMGRNRVIQRILNPYVNFMQATPVIAAVPLMVIWFGIGFEARFLVVFLLSVWSVIINTETGVRGTPRVLMEVAQIYHLSQWKIIRDIALPNAVPMIFAGLRIALGKALIGMIIAETEVTVIGLGGLISNYGDEFKTAYLLAAICAASVVGVITAGLLSWSLRRYFPWVEATSAAAVRD
jgi:NitT/TauT family transport system permease protein